MMSAASTSPQSRTVLHDGDCGWRWLRRDEQPRDGDRGLLVRPKRLERLGIHRTMPPCLERDEANLGLVAERERAAVHVEQELLELERTDPITPLRCVREDPVCELQGVGHGAFV